MQQEAAIMPDWHVLPRVGAGGVENVQQSHVADPRALRCGAGADFADTTKYRNGGGCQLTRDANLPATFRAGCGISAMNNGMTGNRYDEN